MERWIVKHMDFEGGYFKGWTGKIHKSSENKLQKPYTMVQLFEKAHRREPHVFT